MLFELPFRVIHLEVWIVYTYLRVLGIATFVDHYDSIRKKVNKRLVIHSWTRPENETFHCAYARP